MTDQDPASPEDHQQSPAGPEDHQQSPASPEDHQQSPTGPEDHGQGPTTVPNGGLTLASFDVIDEFAAACQADRLTDNDRKLHGSHPLVLLLEGTLEAVSRANLSVAIIGLSRRSEELLVEERRRLEDADEAPALQQFLFSFEQICPIVREAGYGAGDDGDSAHFFEELFPEWLSYLAAWATAAALTPLAERVTAAGGAYGRVAHDIAAHP